MPIYNYVGVGVGSGGNTAIIVEYEGRGVLVGKYGLRTDTPETPWGVGPEWMCEFYHQIVRALEASIG